MLDEEGEEVVKGEEKDLLVEEIGYSFGLEKVQFDSLVKRLIPKLENGVRIKVWYAGNKYYPCTTTGQELVMAYKLVGFSFVPVMVVERPVGEVGRPEVKAAAAQAFNEAMQQPRGQQLRNMLNQPLGGGNMWDAPMDWANPPIPRRVQLGRNR